MANVRFTGPLKYRLRSFLAITRIAIGVHFRHLFGNKIAPDWDANMEIGIRFWRHQFTVAMNHDDIATGRAIYNSLQTLTDDIYDVSAHHCVESDGIWFQPSIVECRKTLLYFHGGGYTFGGPNAERFAAMLAHHCAARVFMPIYRFSPEHPHPAQAVDAVKAWRYLRGKLEADELVLIGDSAGGHMGLYLLQQLKQLEEQQPDLCIALCPWTDIGERGDSLSTNNRYDLVQGWMALRFGQWLDPENRHGREALSPISYDYAGLAPIYVQAGGREMLRDMIIDFVNIQATNGADIMFDLWQDMPHDFQAYDNMFSSSRQALERIRTLLISVSEDDWKLEMLPGVTRVANGKFKLKEIAC